MILTEIISTEAFNQGIFKFKLVEFVKLGINDINSQFSRVILFGFSVSAFAFAILWEFTLNSVYSESYRLHLMENK